MNDVEAVAGVNDAGCLSDRSAEGRLLELRYGYAFLDPAELAALNLAARIVGVVLGKLGEISAVVQLVENVLCLGFGFGIRLGIIAVDFDQDMPHLDLRVDLVVLQVRLIVLLNLGVGNLRSALRQIAVGKGDELELARLGDRIGILCRVLLDRKSVV